MNCAIGGQIKDMKEIWIDVRTVEEYESGHIEGAINIPHEEIGGKIESVVKDKSQKIHLYCKGGRRAGIAKDVLEKMRYTNVINEGGYEDIKKRLEKDPN
ncbi:MAG: rhodanese-like domain-containing protein [Planctomycetes bacterium]|nr:rhodanese-like domain-containing protein [Planctomycetota bacterium]